MAIPTGYTLETFGQWLTGEVFFEDTEGLGLAPLRGFVPATYKDLTLSGNTTFVPTVNSTYTLHIEPSPFIFDRNEVITLDNGVVLMVDPGSYIPSGGDTYLTESVDYGDTTMVVKVLTVPDGTDIHDGLRLRVETGIGVTGVGNPTLESIMNKTLARMGLQTIDQINITNMYTFRRIAVVEALETIMQNEASFYPFDPLSTDATNFYSGQVPDQIRNLFGFESTDLANYISSQGIDLEGGDVVLNISDEVLSANTSVGVVW